MKENNLISESTIEAILFVAVKKLNTINSLADDILDLVNEKLYDLTPEEQGKLAKGIEEIVKDSTFPKLESFENVFDILKKFKGG